MLGSLLFTDAQDGAARRAAEFTQLSGLMESMEHELTVEDMLTLTAEDDSELTTPRTEDTETFRWSGSSYEQAPVAGDDGAAMQRLSHESSRDESDDDGSSSLPRSLFHVIQALYHQPTSTMRRRSSSASSSASSP